jgi:hypothetical protein
LTALEKPTSLAPTLIITAARPPLSSARAAASASFSIWASARWKGLGSIPRLGASRPFAIVAPEHA